MLKHKIKYVIKNIKSGLSKIPIKIWIVLLYLVIISGYVLCFVVPRNIVFSYSENSSCISKLTLLSEIQKQSGGSDFKLQTQNEIKIGNLALFSSKVCVMPVKSPSAGNINISYSPFGWLVFQNNYTINVGDKPKVSAAINKPVALTKPLEFTLDKTDNIFTYKIEINNKTNKCTNDLNKIKCDIKSLGLKQGTKYPYKLIRIFNNKNISNAIEGNLSLISPTSITKTSVVNSEVIYSKPKIFTFETDKTLITADAILEKIDNNIATRIVSTTKITGSTIEISVATDLERESQYRLTLNGAEGQDGSLLESPYTINFQTSGGPNVTNINIGNGGIDANTRVVVTFDQPISQTQDISNIVSLVGGSSTISRSNNQIMFQLHDLPRCGSFSININRGLNSQYDIGSSANWSYVSRVSCRATEVIGYSVMGRPIIAYYYGSGSTTILFTGGIHGDEHSGSYIMQNWIDYLDTNAYKIPADRRVVIVPNVNPDGLAASTRYNANNVNIDRNFASTNWQSNVDIGTGIMAGGGGPSPMSEPETIALANLTTNLQPRLEVSFHAQGSLVGANQYGDSINIGLLYAANVGYTSMIGHADEVMGYIITGEFEEWAGEQYGTPAILIELPTQNGDFFWDHEPTLWKMVNI
ncbi:MAG: DUF2817 domain-containing protein [Candidatus Saccharibacteria bacterium]